jgi:hypothetical protein
MVISATTPEKATLYNRYRLPYNTEAVDDLLARTRPALVVADIGAGTGQLPCDLPILPITPA